MQGSKNETLTQYRLIRVYKKIDKLLVFSLLLLFPFGLLLSFNVLLALISMHCLYSWTSSVYIMRHEVFLIVISQQQWV